MKHFYYIFSPLLFSILSMCIYAHEGTTTTIKTPLIEKTFYASHPIQLEYESFSLSADTGALIHDLTIYVEPLSAKKTADMSVEMVNVTGANADALCSVW